MIESTQGSQPPPPTSLTAGAVTLINLLAAKVGHYKDEHHQLARHQEHGAATSHVLVFNLFVCDILMELVEEMNAMSG